MVRLAVRDDYIRVAVNVRRSHLVGNARSCKQIMNVIFKGPPRSGFSSVHDTGSSVQEVVNISEETHNFRLADLSFGKAENNHSDW